MKKNVLYKFLHRSVNRLVGSIANRAALSEERTLLLEKPAPFSPVLPVNLDELPTAMQPYFHETIELPAVYLHTLRSVAVSWHMVVFRRLRIFLPILAHPREIVHYNDAYLLQEWTGRKQRVPRAARPLVLVHNEWTGSNYYHWLIDALPRLLLLRAHYADHQLLMPAPVAAFVEQSAALLGFTDLVRLEAGRTLVGADLLFPDYVAAPGYQHPALLQRVRQHILSQLYPTGELPVPHRQVYVSRRLQRVRRLLNEPAIETLLVQHGYEVVEFEKMTFVEQVRLMTETHLFISIHGAGLTNMLFLPTGARVGELLNADKIIRKQNQDFENLIYFRMAAALRLPYYCLPCANVESEPPTNDAHLQVDTGAFERLLHQMSS